MKTAVEWLESEMLKPNLGMKEILEQAKELEKQQIIDAFNKGKDSRQRTIFGSCYYQEKFKFKKK